MTSSLLQQHTGRQTCDSFPVNLMQELERVYRAKAPAEEEEEAVMVSCGIVGYASFLSVILPEEETEPLSEAAFNMLLECSHSSSLPLSCTALNLLLFFR